MAKKRVLLSGIGGFIGSHMLSHFLLNTDWDIIGIASWTHKGIPERILENKHYQNNKERVSIITHDLVAPFSNFTKDKIGKIDYIVNVASESHVDRSIIDPVSFIKNNVDLILTMLEFVREIKPEKFIQISTDECYGSAPEGINHKEWSPIIPSNPYAASKASQEAIVISYWRTYGIPLIITNTMNNFGEFQDSEKFIPLVIKKILNNETIFIHGYPDKKRAGSRFYMHARNHADAILFLLNNQKINQYPNVDRPDRFNVVGEKEVDNLEMAQFIYNTVKLYTTDPLSISRGLKYEITDFHSERPGHDTRYGLDGEKLKAMGWSLPLTFEESLRKTILWYLEHKNWLGL